MKRKTVIKIFLISFAIMFVLGIMNYSTSVVSSDGEVEKIQAAWWGLKLVLYSGVIAGVFTGIIYLISKLLKKIGKYSRT